MANRNKEITTPTSIFGNPDLKQTGVTPDSSTAAPLTERDPFYSAFWENVIETSRNVLQGEEPAWWPIRVLFELDDLVTYREMSILSPRKAELAAKLAPIHDSIRKIKTAYSIIAYPHSQSYQLAISRQVAHDQRILQIEGTPRTQFELNDSELIILRKLSETPRYTHAERDDNGRSYESSVKTIHPPLPFDPQRRIFRYSDVPTPRP
jgi:hypothetical protein